MDLNKRQLEKHRKMYIEEFFKEENLKKIEAPNLPILFALKELIIKKNDVIIDFGCGNGRDVNYLSRLGLNVKGYDKNIHLNMIHVGKDLFGNIPIYEGDMTKIQLPERSIDIFLFNSSFHYLKKENLEKFLEKIEKTAKPKARILISEFSEENPGCIKDLVRPGVCYAEDLMKVFEKRKYKPIFEFKEDSEIGLLLNLGYEIKGKQGETK
ncbi:hypothetical protein DRJ22_00905 [Candidatus Woesearchaeota archaeon]|nr:MAG: hypothetical protein B6U93_00580 [Candidatus Woesearchaeota archaeon ex4484_78]RLE46858.1 MAG: hypothetical protein DRJ22_00905 [Candidatus Woesearchaeota archaeon]